MSEHKYTLSEIDEMRELVYKAQNFTIIGISVRGSFDTGPEALRIESIKMNRSRMVEDKLRTYMQAGIRPDDFHNEGDGEYTVVSVGDTAEVNGVRFPGVPDEYSDKEDAYTDGWIAGVTHDKR